MDKKQYYIQKINLSSEEKKKLEKDLQEEIKSFGKQTLTKFIDSKCSRQLFLSFATKNPDWIKPPSREITKRIPTRAMSNFISKQGKIYEQKIYNQMIEFSDVRATKLADIEEISHSKLNYKLFDEIYEDLSKKKKKYSLLLEHQYITPNSFLKDIFTRNNSKLSVPKHSNQRPDILIIRKIKYNSNHPIYGLFKGGKFREISKEELEIKFAINIIDIKNIAEVNVGKKQYLEILYYLWTLTYFISDNQLSDKYFVYLDDNGIFPRYNDAEISDISNYSELFNSIIKIRWRESIRLINNSLKVIKSIWKQSPCSIESIPVNISVACGYCPFLEDCKSTLGMDGIKDPKDWSLKLIPYTSPSIAQQLESLGFTTINDILLNFHKIKIGNTPEAIYPELPLLRIKALAIKNNQIVYPKIGEVYLYSLPKYTDFALTFAVEADTSNDRVFAGSLYLHMSINSKSKLFLKFKKWWSIWNSIFKTKQTKIEIYEVLKNTYFPKIDQESVIKFYDILIQSQNDMKITLQGDKTSKGIPAKTTVIRYFISDINKDLMDPDSEFDLAVKLINHLYKMIELCNILERFIEIEEIKEIKGNPVTFAYHPGMAIFHWSHEQLENIQQLFERNSLKFISNKELFHQFTQLISWFTPSDSNVAHAYQHKKIYNLQNFAETMMGFPSIINYTWHEIGEKLLNTHFSKKFWIEHFNFMDLNPWHNYLEAKSDKSESNTQNIQDREFEIRKRILRKTQTVNRLREEFQKSAQDAISRKSIAFSIEAFKTHILPNSYHNIAKTWYFYSKLTGTMQELEAENYRTIFPEFSIGKLRAAKVSNLQIIQKQTNNGKKLYYNLFEIRNLSSNMKIKVKDHVLLIPEDLRDMKIGNWTRKWVIVIEDLRWNRKISGYIIRSEENRENFISNYQNEVPNQPKDPTWFLYPISIDPWSSKLYSNSGKGLLERNNFGVSWLGHHLENLWNLNLSQNQKQPKNPIYGTPEIFLYSPNILQNPIKTPKQSLISKFHPKPDSSQKNSIIRALNHHIYAIQGPPGTGKSQTIAALIEEYYQKIKIEGKNKTVRILVTSFSYAAIRVIMQKIRTGIIFSEDISMPTKTAEIQKIFLRSESQDPIPIVYNLRDVDDLLRKPSGSWKWNGQGKIITKNHTLEEQIDEDFILFGNAHQLYHLQDRVLPNFEVDLVIVDEASQMSVDQFLPALNFIKKYDIPIDKPISSDSNLTKIIIVGDYNQLPPIQSIEPPKNLKLILDSLFSYYVKHHKINNSQLEINYRSHSDIVEFTKLMGIYENLRPSEKNKSRILQLDLTQITKSWIQEVLDPNKVVSTIIHQHQFELAVSPFEAEIVVNIVVAFYKCKKIENDIQESSFWSESIGVVSPHNAQGRLIIHKIFIHMTQGDRLTKLTDPELMIQLRNSIYSVEKFQGSDREFIIASIGLSDQDQLKAEEEFIYNLNRFNVLTSRAKYKLIYVCSKEFLDYIPEEREIMDYASQGYKYAFQYCNLEKPLFINNENDRMELVYFRWKSFQNPELVSPYSSFSINSIIDEGNFSLEFSPYDTLHHIIKNIPPKLLNYNPELHNEKKLLNFSLKNIELLQKYLPIPKKIIQAYNNSIKETDKEKNGDFNKKPILNMQEEKQKQIDSDEIDLLDEDLF